MYYEDMVMMFGFNEIMRLFGGHVCLGPGRITARVTVPPLRRNFFNFLDECQLLCWSTCHVQTHDIMPRCGQSIALEFGLLLN
ncbi:hypothetical protein NEUTE2DRAFT_154128 [Neurospora tetrasperma FGSC 2509]|nr:hypothetical protein NEUTE2DRAFT_154128 [Neurospora tetrasperma FGSC 2509]